MNNRIIVIAASVACLLAPAMASAQSGATVEAPRSSNPEDVKIHASDLLDTRREAASAPTHASDPAELTDVRQLIHVTDLLRIAADDRIGNANPAISDPSVVTGTLSPVSTFDLSGVRIGMTAPAAAAALRAAGYAVEETAGLSSTYKQMVVDAHRALDPNYAGRYAPSSVSGLRATSARGQEIWVRYAFTKAGPVVSSATYSVPRSNGDLASVLSVAVARYGPVGAKGMLATGATRYQWCERVCDATRVNAVDQDSLSLTGNNGRWELTLTDDGRIYRDSLAKAKSQAFASYGSATLPRI